ncbi:MAG TPA: hypothetical protein VHF25_04420, partial [Nitriliruptorales bacterium]|nr:hypothetical protein [Nitriliruptorales bacterium]
MPFSELVAACDPAPAATDGSSTVLDQWSTPDHDPSPLRCGCGSAAGDDPGSAARRGRATHAWPALRG